MMILLPYWFLQIMWIIVGSWLLILTLFYCIQQLKKLGIFLSIIDEKQWRETTDWKGKIIKPSISKHSGKVMLISLIKLLVFLFVLTFSTYGIFIYEMMLIWVVFLYVMKRYISLWRFHGYSVAFLIIISLVTIMLGLLVSPFIRAFILRLTL